MWTRRHVKYPLFLSGFNATWIFSTDFQNKKAQTSSLIKIRPVIAEFFHAAGQNTDMTKLITAFRNFANALKNCVEMFRLQTLSHEITAQDLHHRVTDVRRIQQQQRRVHDATTVHVCWLTCMGCLTQRIQINSHFVFSRLRYTAVNNIDQRFV
jgi:hypothetical protein